MSQGSKIIYEGEDFYIQREGTQIVAITRATGTEYSRLDIQTRSAIHWYARKICDRIYHHFRNTETPLEIVCLGSAMGAIPYELLSHYPKARVSCVDIDSESLHVLQASVLKEFTGRVLYYEGDAKNFVLTAQPNHFNIVINDLFTEQFSPPFIHSNSFLRATFRLLLDAKAQQPQGLYFANTITDVFEFTHGMAIEKIGYDVERFPKKKGGVTNIVYEASKS